MVDHDKAVMMSDREQGRQQQMNEILDFGFLEKTKNEKTKNQSEK